MDKLYEFLIANYMKFFKIVKYPLFKITDHVFFLLYYLIIFYFFFFNELLVITSFSPKLYSIFCLLLITILFSFFEFNERNFFQFFYEKNISYSLIDEKIASKSSYKQNKKLWNNYNQSYVVIGIKNTYITSVEVIGIKDTDITIEQSRFINDINPLILD